MVPKTTAGEFKGTNQNLLILTLTFINSFSFHFRYKPVHILIAFLVARLGAKVNALVIYLRLTG